METSLKKTLRELIWYSMANSALEDASTISSKLKNFQFMHFAKLEVFCLYNFYLFKNALYPLYA